LTRCNAVSCSSSNLASRQCSSSSSSEPGRSAACSVTTGTDGPGTGSATLDTMPASLPHRHTDTDRQQQQQQHSQPVCVCVCVCSAGDQLSMFCGQHSTTAPQRHSGRLYWPASELPCDWRLQQTSTTLYWFTCSMWCQATSYCVTGRPVLLVVAPPPIDFVMLQNFKHQITCIIMYENVFFCLYSRTFIVSPAMRSPRIPVRSTPMIIRAGTCPLIHPNYF